MRLPSVDGSSSSLHYCWSLLHLLWSVNIINVIMVLPCDVMNCNVCSVVVKPNHEVTILMATEYSYNVTITSQYLNGNTALFTP